MVAALYRSWSAELDEAEQLGLSDSGRARAIEIATRVHEEAQTERDNSRPGHWDEGAWEECTVIMTRASVLLLRFRRGPSTNPPAATNA